MGNHRMFSNSIVDSDKFLDMPLTTQALYFHLGMKADDDGFVSNPKKIVRSVSCTEDDLKLLIAKGFVISFESGVIVITHFHIHNRLRKDRKKDTIFLEEKQRLQLTDSKVYTIVNQLTTNCQPIDNQLTAQDKLSKDKLREDNNLLSTGVDEREEYDSIMDSFNRICISLPHIKKITPKRETAIRKAKEHMGEMTFDELFEKIELSDFLTKRDGLLNTPIGFDWIFTPDNLMKIIEGTYDNEKPDEIFDYTKAYEEEDCND